jgi:hypothetical protein
MYRLHFLSPVTQINMYIVLYKKFNRESDFNHVFKKS